MMFDAANDGAGIGLMMRARDARERYNTQSQEHADSIAALLGDPRIGWNTRMNNARSSSLVNPQWDAYFQALDEASGGMPMRLAGGPPADESNAFNGISTQPRPMRKSVQRLFVGDGRPVLGTGKKVLET